MSTPLEGQTKKQYMEWIVPQLIQEGKTPEQAIAECKIAWADYAAEQSIEICSETSVEFTAEVTADGFKTVLQEENIFADMTFAQVFAMLNCEPGKRYEIEICVEEC